jgi:hypothetical protein
MHLQQAILFHLIPAIFVFVFYFGGNNSGDFIIVVGFISGSLRKMLKLKILLVRYECMDHSP